MKSFIYTVIIFNSILAQASLKENKTKEGMIDFAVSCEINESGCELVDKNFIKISSKIELKVIDAIIKQSENIFLQNRQSNEKVIEIQISDEAKNTLANFTKSNVGKWGYLVLDKEIVFKAVIASAIKGGKMQLSLGKTKQEIIHSACKKIFPGCDTDKAEASGNSNL